MKTILNIAKKEFLDTLRDKRTLIVMIVVPLLLFPLIFTVVGTIQKNAAVEAMDRQLRIGLWEGYEYYPLVDFMEKNEHIQFINLEPAAEYDQLIKQDSLDALIAFSADFDDKIKSMETGVVTFYYESTNDGIQERVAEVIGLYEDELVKERLKYLELEMQVINPVDIEHADISTIQEKIGKYAGGLIPYLFIIFCFIGAMYPAIDLFTGEKERMTIETILTTPVKRLHLLSGKMIVVITSGILSALLAIVGLFLGLNFADTLPAQLTEVVGDILQVKFMVLLLTMLIPLTIFFAGILIPISIYAKSFKEAQSIITPINIIVIIPAVIGMIPGIELSLQTAAIPVINIALATKDIIAGTIDYGLLTIVYGSLILIAIAGVLFSQRYFARENNILRI